MCETLKVKHPEPILDVETRWKRIWLMIERVSSIRPQLQELMVKIRVSCTDCTDLSIGPDKFKNAVPTGNFIRQTLC